MTTRNCQNCENPIGSRDESYLYFSQIICKACMMKMEEKFHIPDSTSSTDSNTKTEIPVTEEQLEQDKDIECQTLAAEEKAPAELEKDVENLKDNTSSGQDDNNPLQQVATESSGQDSEKCETTFDEEAAFQPSLKQESVIEISEYVERTIRKQTGYIGRHWRGELSLATSFWINIFLVDLFLKSVEILTSAFIHNFSTGTHVSIIHNPFIIMILYPWQIIGLWRSCDRHIKTTGKRFWARTAQVLVVLGFIATLSHLVASWPLYDI